MVDHLVIGGGPAGAMLAAGLASHGKDVSLLERSHGPHHKVCGEFLSWEAGAMLRRAGVALDDLGGAPIDRLRIVSGNRQAETHLPGTATGISRFRLDEALLVHAALRGAQVRRGIAVRALEGSAVRLADDSMMSAARIWLATGKQDLRGARRVIGEQRVTADLTGFKLHLRLSPADALALSRTIELHHFDGGYAGLQPIEDGMANLCLLASAAIAEAGWEGVSNCLDETAPLLARRLQSAEMLYDRPLAISRVPYGYIDRQDGGPARIGDQLAVIHSFTGDGMAIAIASGIGAAGSADQPVSIAQRNLYALVERPVQRAAFGYRLLSAGGWPLDLVMRVPALARLAARLTRVA